MMADIFLGENPRTEWDLWESEGEGLGGISDFEQLRSKVEDGIFLHSIVFLKFWQGYVSD
jgi:hypothetical protein